MTSDSNAPHPQIKFSLFQENNHHPVDLSHFNVGEKAIEKLMAFKASERKDDPSRRPDIRGPYEIMVLKKTGKLPESCYEQGDPEPWGLRVHESRSNKS